MAKPELKNQPDRKNPVIDFELGKKFRPFERLTGDDIKKIEEGGGYTMAFRCRIESLSGAIYLTHPVKNTAVDDGDDFAQEWGEDSIMDFMFGMEEPEPPERKPYEVHFYWFSLSPYDLERFKGLDVGFAIEGTQVWFSEARFLPVVKNFEILRALTKVESIEGVRRLEVIVSQRLPEIPVSSVKVLQG